MVYLTQRRQRSQRRRKLIGEKITEMAEGFAWLDAEENASGPRPELHALGDLFF
jgi:hypothetical protein